MLCQSAVLPITIVYYRQTNEKGRIFSNDIVSVGGGIEPDTIDGFLEKVQTDKFNTRMVTFNASPARKYWQAVAEALRFEILMLEHDASQGFITRDEEEFRTQELKKRLK